jgi:hypothetical protein
LCGTLFGGCGGDGDSDFAAIAQAMEECSQSTMVNLMTAFYAVVTVPDVIAGESPFPGFDVNVALSTDPLDPPNTWDFAVVFDTNSNGVADSAVVGKMTFSEDPTDGLSPLATIQIDFTLQNSPLIAGAVVENGTVTGSGSLLATLGAVPEEATISGTISLTDTAGEGCDATLTFPVGTPLNLQFSDFGEPVIEQLAANTGLFEIFGTIEAFIESLGHELDVTLTLTDGDQTVAGDGTLDGVDVDFDFELLPSDEVMNQLASCLFFSGEFVFFFADTFEQIAAAALGGTLPPGVTVTPTANPNVFDFSVDLAVFSPGTFTAGSIAGQATLVFPVVSGLAGITPSEVTFTWTMTAATLDSGQVASGQSTAGRPLRLQLDGSGTVIAFSGAGTITTLAAPLAGIVTMADCVLEFDIPENAAVAADESDGLVILTIRLVGGEDEMVAIIDFSDEEGVITVNGIPVPFFPV